MTIKFTSVLFMQGGTPTAGNSQKSIKENEVGGACGTYGRGEESVQGFGGKAQRKETTRKTQA
jgi:hypothetical protein